MAINKVVYGQNTLIDLTGDTVTPETLAIGQTAHNRAGAAIVGTMQGGGDTGGLLDDGENWVRPSTWPTIPNDVTTFEGEYFLYSKKIYKYAWFILNVRTDNGQWRVERGTTDDDGVFHALSVHMVNSRSEYSEDVDYGDEDYIWYRVTAPTGHITSIDTRLNYKGQDYSRCGVIEWICRVPNASYIGSISYCSYATVEHMCIYDSKADGGGPVGVNATHALKSIELHSCTPHNPTKFVMECSTLQKNVVFDNSVMTDETTSNLVIVARNLFFLDLSDQVFTGLTGASIRTDGSNGLRGIRFPPNMPSLSDYSYGMSFFTTGLVTVENCPPITKTLNITQAPHLTVESLIDIIRALVPVETTQTLNMGQFNKGKLTAEQIAVATGKGWTIT